VSFFNGLLILLMRFISTYRAAKGHNLNNRGCKPTVRYKLNVSALKGAEY
jgi:hypothetical protein